MLEELQHPPVVDGVIEATDVRIEYPVHLSLLDPDRERIQRIMRPAPGSKPVREAQEVRLIDGVQHLDHRPLKELVLQRGDPERPLPPVRLRYVRPARRSCPVAPAVNPRVQVTKVLFEIAPVVCPRRPVRSRRGAGLERPIRRPQAVDIDVVQERDEPRTPILLRHSAHALQRTWHAYSGFGPGACFAGRVPLGQPDSLRRLRDRSRGVVRRPRRYYRAVRLPTLVHLGLTALAFPERPASPSP